MGERKVLLVDDDEILLHACSRALGRTVRLFIATTSAEARQVAQAELLDAIVVDYLLGRENGIELVRELKERRPACRFLLLSGHASIETTVTAMRAGADDVKQKPVHPRALVRWVETGTWDRGDTSTTATEERIVWEYAHRVVAECGGNISEAARRLGVQRLTLRRRLEKSAPRR